MGTPRSRDRTWTAGVQIFSGRPDPVWPLARADAARLVATWESLAPLDGGPPEAPPLGYRGCFADAGDGVRRWEAYAGAVTCGGQTRADPSREVERLIIASGPAGLLPANIRELAGV